MHTLNVILTLAEMFVSRTLTRNIRQRRGEKVAINIPGRI